MTVVVHAWTRVRPGARSELDVLRASLTEASRRDPGCLSYDPVARVDDPDVVGFVERWESRDALAEHLSTPHFAEYGRASADLVEGPADITVYDVAGTIDLAELT